MDHFLSKRTKLIVVLSGVVAGAGLALLSHPRLMQIDPVTVNLFWRLFS